jgi:hypothetical protein
MGLGFHRTGTPGLYQGASACSPQSSAPAAGSSGTDKAHTPLQEEKEEINTGAHTPLQEEKEEISTGAHTPLQEEKEEISTGAHTKGCGVLSCCIHHTARHPPRGINSLPLCTLRPVDSFANIQISFRTCLSFRIYICITLQI